MEFLQEKLSKAPITNIYNKPVCLCPTNNLFHSHNKYNLFNSYLFITDRG